MKTKSKIFLTGGAVVVVALGLFGIHEVMLKQAQQKVDKASIGLIAENKKLATYKAELTKYEKSSPSNIHGQFPETKFQKTASVVLPLTVNYKIDNSKVAEWVVTYINELRKLNGISSKIIWAENSPEQTFAHQFATGQDVKFEGKYDLMGYSLGGNDNPIPGRTESDQETAYQIVMTLYDQSGEEGYQANLKGDYASRANLLYDEPAVGVDTSDGVAIAIDHQQREQDKSAYTTMYNASQNPKTNPLPNVTFYYVDSQILVKAQEKIKSAQSKVSAESKKVQKAKAQLDHVKHYFF